MIPRAPVGLYVLENLIGNALKQAESILGVFTQLRPGASVQRFRVGDLPQNRRRPGGRIWAESNAVTIVVGDFFRGLPARFEKLAES